jgi:acyl carrier protein
MKSDVNRDVREFILKTFPLARKRQVRDSDALLEGGILDSLGILEVVSFIGQRYGIAVEDYDLIPEHFQTIERMVAYIQTKAGVLS